MVYEQHQEALAAMANAGTGPGTDTRWQEGLIPLPWAVCWGGLVALPMALVRQHELTGRENWARPFGWD